MVSFLKVSPISPTRRKSIVGVPVREEIGNANRKEGAAALIWLLKRRLYWLPVAAEVP